MHELSIAEALLEVCEREVAARGGATIEALRVAVGELSGVEPDLLQFAWEGLLIGTRHEGSTLEIDFRRATQTCAACGEIAERAPGSWLRLCPQCDRPLQVVGGDELDLLSLTLIEENVIEENVIEENVIEENVIEEAVTEERAGSR